MREFGYYILFRAYRNERNHCETTKDNDTYFQEHKAIRFCFTMQYQWKISRFPEQFWLSPETAFVELSPPVKISETD